MHKNLSELENGGFKNMKEFERYMVALNGVGSDSEVGQAYFKKMISVFLERFRLTFEKHIASQQLAPETIHCMLGGDKHHAQAFARWIVSF